MLRDAIKSCIAAMNESRDIQGRRNAEKALQEALGLLSGCTSSLKQTLSTIEAFQSSDVARQPVLTEAVRSNLLEHIRECGSAVYQSEEHTVDLTRENVLELKHIVQALQTDLEQAWRRDSHAYLEGPAGYLSMIGGLMDNPAKAKKLEQAAMQMANETPTRRGIREFETDVRNIREIVEQFSLDPSVEDFLKKVSGKRATLEDVTPEIAQWLRQNHLTQKIRVSF